MEADTVCGAGVAGSVEKFFRASWVCGVLRDVGFIGPMIWRKDAAGYAGPAACFR